MIRSTIPANYRLRSAEKAIIEVAITQWSYEPLNKRYVATVEDHAVITNDGIESKVFVNSKQVFYPDAQIDALFTMMESPINVGDSFSEKMMYLVSMALLHITVTDLYQDGTTIYGLQPNEWKLDEN